MHRRGHHRSWAGPGIWPRGADPGAFPSGFGGARAVLGDADAVLAPQGFLAAQPEVISVDLLPDGRLELALPGDEEASAALLSRTVAAGHRVASFAPATSDLEELFLQITAVEEETAA